MKTEENQICFYCERKALLFWKQAYICLLKPDALYLLKKPRNASVREEEQRTVLALDANAFENAPNLQKFSAENTTDYRFEITYDPQMPDWTPLDEVDRYCVLSFRIRGGKKLILRSGSRCDAEAIRTLADKIFSNEKGDIA